jgi:hypothetical protein
MIDVLQEINLPGCIKTAILSCRVSKTRFLLWCSFLFLGSIYNDRTDPSTRRVYKICSSLVRIRDIDHRALKHSSVMRMI